MTFNTIYLNSLLYRKSLLIGHIS